MLQLRADLRGRPSSARCGAGSTADRARRTRSEGAAGLPRRRAARCCPTAARPLRCSRRGGARRWSRTASRCAGRLIVPKESVAAALGRRAARPHGAAGRPDRVPRDQCGPSGAAAATRVLVVAESLQHVEESVDRVLLLLLLAGLPAALAATAARRLVAGAQGAAAGRADDLEGGADRHRPAARADRRAARTGRDRAPRGDAQRDARPPRARASRRSTGWSPTRRTSCAPRSPRCAPSSTSACMDDDLSPAAREVLESAREEVDRMSRIGRQPADAGAGRRGPARAAHDTGRPAARRSKRRSRPLRPLAAAKGLHARGERRARARRRPTRSACTRRSRTSSRTRSSSRSRAARSASAPGGATARSA